MIVVTTPTGHIGSQVVQVLLAAGGAVRVIARDPARLAAEVRAKVKIVQGSSDDEGMLMRSRSRRKPVPGGPTFFYDKRCHGILPPVHPSRLPRHQE